MTVHSVRRMDGGKGDTGVSQIVVNLALKTAGTELGESSLVVLLEMPSRRRLQICKS